MIIINIVAVLIVLAVVWLICSHIYFAVLDLLHFKEYNERIQTEREARLIAKEEIKRYSSQNKEPEAATAAIYDSIYH